MSCGDPHDVDCREVIARALPFLDHTLAETGSLSYEAIEQHLRECQHCQDEYGGHVEVLAQVVRAVLTRCCGNEHAPHALRMRVRQSIRVSITSFEG